MRKARTVAYLLVMFFFIYPNDYVLGADKSFTGNSQKFDISAKLIDAALVQLAQQANKQLIMNADSFSLLKNIELKENFELSGWYTPAQALAQLLQGTGLRFHFTSVDTFVVTPKPSLLTKALDIPKNNASLLEEVVVTSQKREQRLQDVPIAVTVFTRSQINQANITRSEQLVQLAPTVTFDIRRDFGTSSFRIRGIGTLVLESGVEPSVATVIDGVVMSQGGVAVNEFPDTERIEILNGPQGTLFGKNASAGLVHIITKPPNVEEQELFFEARTTDDRDYRTNFAMSGPLNDQLAFRYSGYWRNYDGNVKNVFSGKNLNGVDAFGSRAKLLWQPTQATAFLLSIDYADQDTECCIRVLREDVLSVTVDPSLVGDNTPAGSIAEITGLSIGDYNNQVNVDRESANETTHYGLSVNATIDFDGYVLSSISSYRHFTTLGIRDNDETPIRFSNSQQAYKLSNWFSQELRLNSPVGGRYDFILGFYYYRADNSSWDLVDRVFSSRTLGNNGIDQLIIINAEVDNKNYAVFGHFNWEVWQQLTFFGGFRQLHDSVAATISRKGRNLDTSGALIMDFATGPVSNGKGDTQLISKLGFQYALTADITTYTFFSTGFKGRGFTTEFGFNPERFLTVEPVSPETSDSFEIGFKSVLFGNRAQVNVAGFATTINNLQLTVRNLTTLENTLGSVPEVSTRGLDIDFTVLPMDGLTLTGGIAYTEAVFENFSNALCYLGQTATQGCIDDTQNLTGSVLPNAPRWKSIFSARYEKHLFKNLSGFIQADYLYQSKVLFLDNADPGSWQKNYSIVDLSIGAGSVNGRYEVTLFINNLFNQEYVTGVSSNGLGGGGINLHTIPRNFNRYIGAAIRIQI